MVEMAEWDITMAVAAEVTPLIVAEAFKEIACEALATDVSSIGEVRELPTGADTALPSEPTVPHQRIPPPGLNPATMADDIARLQTIQEDKEAAMGSGTSDAPEPTHNDQRHQVADRDGEDQEAGEATVTEAAPTATAPSLAVEGAVLLSNGEDDEK